MRHTPERDNIINLYRCLSELDLRNGATVTQSMFYEFLARCNARAFVLVNNKARIDSVGSPSQYASFREFTLSVFFR